MNTMKEKCKHHRMTFVTLILSAPDVIIMRGYALPDVVDCTVKNHRNGGKT
jgi:hypothetical protein